MTLNKNPGKLFTNFEKKRIHNQIARTYMILFETFDRKGYKLTKI